MPFSSQSYLKLYNSLAQNPELLRAMAEFVARYRVFMIGSQNESILCNETMYQDLCRRHLNPALKTFFTKKCNEESTQKGNRLKAVEFTRCIATVLYKAIECTEFNDAWAVRFISACAQFSSDLWPLRQPLIQEQIFFQFRNMIKPLAMHSHKKPARKEFKRMKKTPSQWREHLNWINLSFDYIDAHIPEQSDDDRLLSFFSSSPIIFMVYDLYHANYLCALVVLLSFAAIKILDDEKVFDTLFFTPVVPALSLIFYQCCSLDLKMICFSILFLPMAYSLYHAINALKPSHFTFQNMPQHMNSGLILELEEHIKQIAMSYTPITAAPCSTPMASANTIIHSTITTALSFFKKDETASRKATQPAQAEGFAAPLVSFLKELPAPVVYIWKTLDHKQVVYQPGVIKPDIVPLWSTSKKLEHNEVALFPREEMRGERGLIDFFGKTAAYGHIVHERNKPGYKKISNQEKRSKKYDSPKEAIYKIKTPPHTLFFGDYRAPVIPCALHPEDKPTPNRPRLLEVCSPIRPRDHS